MKLSAPIYHLKRKAKLLSRQDGVPLHDALDRIAAQEGYGSWSFLADRQSRVTPAAKIFAQIKPGDLVLLGARPGQGKTVLSLRLAVEATKASTRSAFYTLEYTEKDVWKRLCAIGAEPAQLNGLFKVDCSDFISADYIIDAMASEPQGTLVIIDYLQLLDQKREKPALAAQIAALKSFARSRGVIIICISQIDRSYDPAKKLYPDFQDVRLPNPLDLTLFDKMIFLNNGKVQLQAAKSD